MLFRNRVGKLVNIEKNNYTTDMDYYLKICELYKPNTTDVVVDIKEAHIFKYIMSLL